MLQYIPFQRMTSIWSNLRWCKQVYTLSEMLLLFLLKQVIKTVDL